MTDIRHNRCAPGRKPIAREGDVKAEKLLAKVAPSEAAYRAYRRQAEKVVGLPEPLPLSPLAEGYIAGFEMRESVIFQRAYLVAYADPVRLQAEFSSTDALTVANLRLAALSPPPFVLLSETKKKSKGPFFRSVLEHEFVHVNQAIRGAFPPSPKGKAKDLVENILQVTRAEYEANLIQLARWPHLYLRQVPRYLREGRGLSLDRWCVLRGYTQGLERIIAAAVSGRIQEGEFMEFIDRLPAALPPGFRRIGFDQALGKEYAANLQGYLLTACQNLARHGSEHDSLCASLWDRIRQRRQHLPAA